MKKRALITGLTGQDGSFLAEFLLERGYEVFGLVRRETWFRPNNASHLADRVQVLFGNMSEGVDISSALQDAQPDEIYNLASQSRPGESWARAPETLTINGMGTLRLFEAVRHGCPKARQKLGWEPTISFEQMVGRMADAQLARLESQVGSGK